MVPLLGHSSQPLTILQLAAEPANETVAWQAIREICYRTGNDRPPSSADDWKFFTRVWIDPYQKLLPQWTYVARANERIVGYLTGCPDSTAFARTKFLSCTLPFLGVIALGHFRTLKRARGFVLRELGIEKKPEEIFSASIKRCIKRDYPAHLHMNVAASHQRTGVGSALLDRYASDIRCAGVQGIHLYCTTAPLRFYLRFGFTELAAAAFRGEIVHALGFRF